MVTPIRNDAMLSGKARDNIQNAIRYCEDLAAFYGEHHDDTIRAYRTLARSLGIALDADRLYGEDDMSLGGVFPYGVTFGVIAHPTRNMCSHSGCSHYMRPDQTIGYYSTTTPHAGDHDWSRPVGSPDPVAWSVHT